MEAYQGKLRQFSGMTDLATIYEIGELAKEIVGEKYLKTFAGIEFALKKYPKYSYTLLRLFFK